MNSIQYQEYLKSDHWKGLRQKKLKKTKFCWACHSLPQITNVHHLRYRRIYDVKVTDLRLLCHYCHQFYHAIKYENPKLREKELWKRVRKLRRAVENRLGCKSLASDYGWIYRPGGKIPQIFDRILT